MKKKRDRYACVPGRLWREPSIAGLSLSARGLFFSAWSYFADQMTDAFLPTVGAHQLAPDPKVRKAAIAELLEAGAWEDVPGGYRCRLYLAHNITRDGWEKEKAAIKKRVDKHRGNDGATPEVGAGNALQTPFQTDYPQTQDAGRRTPMRDSLASAARVGFVRAFEEAHATTHGGPTGKHLAMVLDAAEADTDPADFIESSLRGFFDSKRMASMNPPHPVRFYAEDVCAWAAEGRRGRPTKAIDPDEAHRRAKAEAEAANAAWNARTA